MRSKNVVFASSATALLSLVLVIGCGDDGAPAADAAPPDAPEGPPDAGSPDAGGPVEYSKQTATLAMAGISMQYVEVGNPAGTETVIMLHDYTDSSRSFFPTIAALTALDPDLHIFALDLRGHGGTSMPNPAECADNPRDCFELSDFADDVFEFMVARNITTAHLVGHALGSLVAQELATTTSASFESLVLIGAAANVVDNPVLQGLLTDTIEGTWQAALEADSAFDWPRDAYELTPRAADPDAEAWVAMDWVLDATADPAFLAKIVPEATDTRLGTWLGVAEMLNETNNIGRLRTLAVPSLIIWATQDVLFPEDPFQADLRAALDVAVEDCLSGYIWKEYGKAAPPEMGQSDLGNATHWGAPAQVAADIKAFIATGKPTRDRYFANPLDLTEIETEADMARSIEKAAATDCR